MRQLSLFVCAGLALIGQPLSAQYQTRSWLTWRTIETGRFTVHFPTELNAWAHIVSGRLGTIDSMVSRVVGFRPNQRIDVVIDDPFRIPNGSAWPLLDAPRVVLWATPPSPREDVGNIVSWADMLATHEYAHIAHLLRPSRNSWQSLLWKLAPVELGPLSRKSPRWLIEGYATYIEGLVTGSGRPNGVWRSSILRQWAIEGALPSYSQLDAMTGMYGGDFAYLAGSAFIDWLTSRRGDSSLVALWRRLSARRDRGFTEAFSGVYGEPPAVLYGRFAAEVTAGAKRTEADIRRLSADTGITIQHLARETGDPAISHDGGRAAIMLASASRPARVVIWSTLAEPDTMAERAARALLARDPGDVAPYRPFPPAKRALATLHAVGNQPYQDPRFFRDGRVLVWRNSARGDGSWSPDLFVWDPQRHTIRRLTRRANLRQGDPSPDGTSVAATRCASGTCDLVLVDARSGAVSPLIPGSDTLSFHRPRFSPDGQHIAVSVRSGGYWRIGLVALSDRSLRILTTGSRNHFDPAFADDSAIVATSDESGILNLVRIGIAGSGVRHLTAVSGAAVAPEVNPADGSVWFLSLHARGWDVRSARLDGRVPLLAAQRDSVVPRLLATSPVPPSTGYRPDRKWVYFPGGSLVRDGASLLLGIANTDPVGKHELLFQAAKSISPSSRNAALEGATLALIRRSRIPATISAFGVRQGGPFGYSMNGGAIWGERLRRFDAAATRLMLGGTWSQVRRENIPPESPVSRWVGFVEASLSATRFDDGRRTTGQIILHNAGGRRDRARFTRELMTATLSSTVIPFSFTAQRGFSTGPADEAFTLGGSPPTLLPHGVAMQYIAQPVLSPFFTGSHVETYRLSVPFAGLRLYGWSGRAYDSAKPSFEHVAGIEWSGSIAAIPALGTPAARATIGVGHWLNERQVVRFSASGAGHVTPNGPIAIYFTSQFGDWAR